MKFIINTKEEIFIHASSGGQGGEINLLWDAVKGALNYVVQICTNNFGVWKHLDITDDPFYMIRGLRPGKRYFFRIAPVFKEGQGKWSNHVSKRVE